MIPVCQVFWVIVCLFLVFARPKARKNRFKDNHQNPSDLRRLTFSTIQPIDNPQNTEVTAAVLRAQLVNREKNVNDTQQEEPETSEEPIPPAKPVMRISRRFPTVSSL